MYAITLEEIANTGKKAEKQRLLKTLDESTKRLVQLCLDQNITFGVTAEDDDGNIKEWNRANKGGNAGRAMSDSQWTSWFLRSLKKFEDRDLTGNAALSVVLELIQRAPSELHAMWAGRIINRNLRAGFDRSTFNKAFGDDAVKKFEVQLADSYDAQELEGEWCFEPKLDGNRVVGYRGQPTSRGNKIYPAAQPIFDELRAIKGWFNAHVPDGEMMGNLGFDKSSGALRRSSGKGEKANFTYWLFDLFTLAEYDVQATVPLRERKERLIRFFEDHGSDLPNVQMVPWKIIKNPTHKQVMEITAKFVADGFEGAMAKRMDAPAKFGRGPDLLKVKLFFEDDFKVVDFYEGKGQHKGSLGGLIVEGTIKWSPSPDVKKTVYKIRSEVGGGFGHKADPNDPTKVLRQDVWKNKKDWLGAIVQVQFQSPTEKEKDGYKSLRLPVFMMRRKDKE